MNKLYSIPVYSHYDINGNRKLYIRFIIMWGDGFCQDVTVSCYEHNTIKFRWSKKYCAIISYSSQDILSGLKTWMQDQDIFYYGSLS